MQSFIQDYGLDLAQVTFVGGGGGAAAVVPHLAKKFKVPYKIAKNAEVISPIGVALAMVRDMVERSIQNPTKKISWRFGAKQSGRWWRRGPKSKPCK